MKRKHVTDLRKELQDVLDSVYYKEEPIVIYKRNKPWVVIRPLNEHEKKS